MKHLLVLISFLFSVSFAHAQNIVQKKNVENINVTSSKAIFLGKTKPIREIVDVPLLSKEKKDKYKKDKKKPDNFKNRLDRVKIVKPELEHQGIDPVWQSSHSRNFVDGVEPIVNINGIGSGSPTDPTGSIGLEYYLQAINATPVGVWDKEGNMITQFNMSSLWTELGFGSTGDPIILFDQVAERWILTEFAFPGSLLIGVSETSDPLGSYYAYNFETPSFPDYPKFGIWSDHLVVSSNEGGFGTLHQYFIEREALLNGEDARMQRVEIAGPQNPEQGFIVSTPVDWEGKTFPEDSRPIVFKLNDSSWGEVDQDAVELFRFDIDYDNESNTQVESLLINTSPFDGFPCWPGPGFSCCPQPNGDPLDAIPEVVMNAPQYRNFGSHEAIVLSFVTDVTDGDNHAGVRWMELRRDNDQDWYLYQEGSYAPDANHRYMSGIGIDRKGNISMAYTVSSDSVYAGIRYTGRYDGDPLGEMTIPEVSAIEGNSTLNTNGRFSDYSHISVDPTDEVTFWYTNEYANGGTARTRIISWQLSRDTFDMSARAIIRPNSGFDLGTAEEIEVEVTNAGIETANSYEVSYSFGGAEVESMVINDPLTSGSRRMHTFSITQDLSAIGSYDFTARVDFAPDTNPNNNEVSKTVEQRPANDIALEVSGTPTTCNIVSLINFQITNNGGQELTEATIDIELGGSVVDSYDWTGNLSFGQSESFDYLLTNIPDGLNDYIFRISSPNASEFTPDDNVTDFQLTSSGAAGLVVLNLETDDYPNETSWTITLQDSDEVIAEGGNYTSDFTLYTEEICLDPDGCYTFTVFDSYGDGFCCAFGDGFFGLNNIQGQTIFMESAEFGAQLSVDFCTADIDCTINLETDVQDASTDGSLGSIMVSATGGQGSYEYSIDGGVNFQESNIFDNLDEGEYTIIINSGDCQESISVMVGLILNVDELFDDQILISATPNPNVGFFDLSIKNYSGSDIIKFEVLDIHGKIIQSRRMGKFSGVYMTQVSLLNYPDGTYFIRFLDQEINQLVKIIKMN